MPGRVRVRQSRVLAEQRFSSSPPAAANNSTRSFMPTWTRSTVHRGVVGVHQHRVARCAVDRVHVGINDRGELFDAAGGEEEKLCSAPTPLLRAPAPPGL